jgi:superfamily II DNA or RNA helicase
MSPDKFLQNLNEMLRSPRDDLAKTFFEPSLKICKLYRRNTAWFRQSAIGVYAPALRHFIDNDGKMEMLVSLTGKVNSDVIEALERTKDEESKKRMLLNFGDDSIKKIAGLKIQPNKRLFQHHVLIYLLAKKRLEIRFAITKPFADSDDEELYHEKAGYMTFNDGNSLAFLANFNESGGSIRRHGERMHIWKSTDKHNDAVRQDYINEIDLQWNGKDEFTEVHRMSEETLQKVKEYALSDDEMRSKNRKFEEDLRKQKQKEKNKKKEIYIPKQLNCPQIPEIFNGRKFELKKHQIKALEKWQDSGLKGILAHATGSGKTVTAICGLCKLAEKAKTVVVIGVPYQSLADQWIDELLNFNIKAIGCFDKKSNWFLEAQQAIAKHDIMDPNTPYVTAMVVVNKTLNSSDFQKVISVVSSDELIFIGDECHRYGGEDGVRNLPKASIRLGLSATPFKDGDYPSVLIQNNQLKEYFGDVCDTFLIKEALRIGVLCPYRYYPISIHLTDKEYEEYKEYAKKLYLGGDDQKQQEPNMASISGMARVLGSAENKFKKFKKEINENGLSGPTIVFCGDGTTELESDQLTENEQKDKERAHKILREHGVRAHFFTSDESSKERKEVLEDFSNGDIQSLISIRVLDEGIDVPEVKNAFLLASSKSRRQFVQRRGRILRKSENKDFANLYDFVCLPPSGESKSAIVDGEIKRMKEMIDDCQNKEENIRFLKTLISKYDINESTYNELQELISYEREK